ncbi:hypothetical protein [Spirosoma validum]|uniref:Lipoprotein n=1 Tax=Spirosoma validum TaxID=2771355 RepID=A0A927GE76_9BACT|nr:hypothetical protein [Spirosoma validum]MBD2754330.1 hypothetical protein [Spirosoma validum]
MKRVKSGIVFLLLWVGLSTCQSSERQSPDAPKQITTAFYHWKSTYNPTHSESAELKSLTINKLYLHVFDVDWDEKTRQPVPKALIRFGQKPVGNVVPVVFITNRTLANLSPAALPDLSTHIAQAILRISRQNAISFREVQVDCDWSMATRDRYFRLLTLLKNKLRLPLSATIRLHQIKYTDQTGIPPVARGMLMLYNVADWKRIGTRNSIYDADVANQYISFVSTYPLPLDLVLPLFRWTVVYRNNRFLTFLNNVDRKTLVNATFLLAQADSARFMASRDTVAFGFSIRRNDLFRAESVSAETLLHEKKRLLEQISNKQLTFALYHLDSTVLSIYSRETIHALLRPLP